MMQVFRRRDSGFGTLCHHFKLARRRTHLGVMGRNGSVVRRSSFSFILAHYQSMCRFEELEYDVYDTLLWS
jgi:hypothetical protein